MIESRQFFLKDLKKPSCDNYVWLAVETNNGNWEEYMPKRSYFYQKSLACRSNTRLWLLSLLLRNIYIYA
jgi:hypothetical protein